MATSLITDQIIRTNMLIEWTYYDIFAGANQTDYLTDATTNLTVDGKEYFAADKFLSISGTKNAIDSDNDSVTITINTINATSFKSAYSTSNRYVYTPNFFIRDNGQKKVKGSSIVLKRVFLDESGGLATTVSPNPIGRFYGFVKTFTITDVEDPVTKTGYGHLVLNCASKKSVVFSTISGRFTNRKDIEEAQNVPRLAGANLNWGKK